MDRSEHIEKRLTDLEIKSGFAEDLLDAIHRTLYRQQQQIERMEQTLQALREQVSASGRQGHAERDELPPHY